MSFDSKAHEGEERPIQRAAVHWAMLLSSGQASVRDHAEFERWRSADRRHAEAYREASALWQDIPLTSGLAELEPLDAPVVPLGIGEPQRAAKTRSGPRPSSLWYAGAAAAAVIAVIFFSTMRPAAVGVSEPVYVTQTAEVREVRLDDGSVITLGADSRIDVVFAADARRASLIAGEAFFSVAKDASRPFLVTAGEISVRVVGTQFEIRHRPDQVQVAVVEGVVEVSQVPESSVTADSSMLLRRQVLTAGQEIALYAGVLEPVQELAPAGAGAWREGRLVYDGASLAEIVADANRYSDRRIELGNAELGAMRLTATFNAHEIDRTLAALERALPLVAERRGDDRIVLKPKPARE